MYKQIHDDTYIYIYMYTYYIYIYIYIYISTPRAEEVNGLLHVDDRLGGVVRLVEPQLYIHIYNFIMDVVFYVDGRLGRVVRLVEPQTHAREHARTHTAHTHTGAHTQARTHTAHTHTHTGARTHARTRTAHTHTHRRAHTRTHAHTCTHTRAHTGRGVVRRVEPQLGETYSTYNFHTDCDLSYFIMDVVILPAGSYSPSSLGWERHAKSK
jgi:hypothetical protein